MGYKDNQFFGIEDENFLSQSDVTNPEFKFTDRSRVVRTLTYSNGLLKDTSKPMGRGFIRNIITNVTASGENNPFAGSTRTRLRCNFQFNPQDIEQSVEARRDMYLPILQDPSQFTQPIAGNTSFRFELIFDRIAEVNKKESNGSTIFDSSGVLNSTVASDPSIVGVLADLRILHSIIGQGFNKDSVENQVSKFIADTRRYANSNFEELNLQVDSSGNLTPENLGTEDAPRLNPTGQRAFDYLSNPTQSTTDFVNLNVGNSAILLPQPVRVVFSSLFMVDGFVMNSQILFTRFSRTLIPTQCKVVLSMQAVYLGFARQKTFIQDQLQKTDQKLADDWYTANQNLMAFKQKIEDLKIVNVGLFTNKDRLSNASDMNITFTNPDNGKKFKHHVDRQYPWMYASKNFWYDKGDEENYVNYSNTHISLLAAGNTTVSSKAEWYQPFVNGTNDNFNKGTNPTGKNPSGRPHFSISYCSNNVKRNLLGQSLFVDLSDQNPSLRTRLRVNVYGMFDTNEAATSASIKISNSPKFDGSKPAPTGCLLMGKYATDFFDGINTKDMWDNYVGGFGTYNSSSPQDTLVNSANDPVGGKPDVVSYQTDIYNRKNRAPTENCITPYDVYEEVLIAFQAIYSSSPLEMKKRLLNLIANEPSILPGSENIWESIANAADPYQRAVELLFDQINQATKRNLIENENILQFRYSYFPGVGTGLNSLLPFAHSKFKDKWFIFDINVESSLSFTPSGNVSQTIKSEGCNVLVVQGSDWGRTLQITTGEWK